MRLCIPTPIQRRLSERLPLIAWESLGDWNVLQVIVNTEMTYTHDFLSDPYISSILQTLNQQQASDD